eukprot:1273212-Lingulodinium_polyedra.AAC.1
MAVRQTRAEREITERSLPLAVGFAAPVSSTSSAWQPYPRRGSWPSRSWPWQSWPGWVGASAFAAQWQGSECVSSVESGGHDAPAHPVSVDPNVLVVYLFD